MSTASKLRCAIYAAIALIALVATWSQNIAYLDSPATFLGDFLTDLKVNAATRSFTVDLLLVFLAASILMVIEARKHGIPFVWAYIAGGLLIAISVTFPLFLIARELRTGGSYPDQLTAPDKVLLTVIAVAVLGGTVWVNVL
jgi:Terpene cyclase DEP1